MGILNQKNPFLLPLLFNMLFFTHKSTMCKGLISPNSVFRNGVQRHIVKGTKFESDWLRADPTVLVLGFLGWTIPSAIPVSGFGGSSLFVKFLGCIGDELKNFPVGPSIDSELWIYLILYHVGLFLCIMLGQIGIQGQKEVNH